MSDSKERGPSYFVNGSVRESQAGKKYVWSKTFDLDVVKKELGTNIVTVTIIPPQKPKNPEERLIIFNPSEAKFLPKDRGESKGAAASSDDDIVV